MAMALNRALNSSYMDSSTLFFALVTELFKYLFTTCSLIFFRASVFSLSVDTSSVKEPVMVAWYCLFLRVIPAGLSS